MFDWLLPEDHAISVIKADHDRLKELFSEYESSDKSAEKKRIVEDTLKILKLHAAMEEEIFYPAVRPHVGVQMMNEADEEHHVARVLIAELDAQAGDPGHLDAKFTVLAENIRHHINEEEEQVLPKAQEMSVDFERLGREMIALRGELLRTGVPDDAEHLMLAKAGKKDDTPAKTTKATARKHTAKHATAKKHVAAKKKPAPARRKAAASPSSKKRAARR
jgi:hemerythrin superfamily protein